MKSAARGSPPGSTAFLSEFSADCLYCLARLLAHQYVPPAWISPVCQVFGFAKPLPSPPTLCLGPPLWSPALWRLALSQVVSVSFLARWPWMMEDAATNAVDHPSRRANHLSEFIVKHFGGCADRLEPRFLNSRCADEVKKYMYTTFPGITGDDYTRRSGCIQSATPQNTSTRARTTGLAPSGCSFLRFLLVAIPALPNLASH
eukprot:COSAG02_NODE_8168_length_2680_cov_1.244091_4_plen_203_part_00